MKVGQASPNPQVLKRIKGKQSEKEVEQDQTKMIEELKKAGFDSMCYITLLPKYPIMCETFFVTIFLPTYFFNIKHSGY